MITRCAATAFACAALLVTSSTAGADSRVAGNENTHIKVPPPTGGDFRHSVALTSIRRADRSGPLYVYPTNLRLPAYPFKWLEVGFDGAMTLQFTIDEQGVPSPAKLKESTIHEAAAGGGISQDFADACAAAISEWRFKWIWGKPAATAVLCTIEFKRFD